MSRGPRQQALQYLCAVLERQVSLSQLLQADDAPLVKELCWGVCRYFFVLEAIADLQIKKRPQSMTIWVVILLGLYQLACLRKPPYAVVKETVALLETPKLRYAKGFVNGVLRQFCRTLDGFSMQAMLERRLASPSLDWVSHTIQQDWPTLWPTIFSENMKHPPMHLRVNLSKISREAYGEALQNAGHAYQIIAAHAAALTLIDPCDVRSLPGFREGWISVQDVNAQWAVPLLAATDGMRVLDACAAPGGKTAQLLESVPGVQCVALDIDEVRLKRVSENLQRLGLSAEIRVGDGRLVSSWWDGQLFDRILLDAPCSAAGVVRRHPDLLLLRTAADVERVMLAQTQLLDALWPLLKPGGRLVYVTCSVLRRENEGVLEAFLSRTPTATAVPFILPDGQRLGHGWQLLPGDGQGDGFYYAVLEKKSLISEKF